MKLPFVNTKPIRLIELFGGIGSQAKAFVQEITKGSGQGSTR